MWGKIGQFTAIKGGRRARVDLLSVTGMRQHAK